MKRGKKRIIGLVIFAVAVALIAGYIKFFNGTFLYISTGLKDDVVLKAGNSKAYTWEADILLSDAKKEYENVFGSGNPRKMYESFGKGKGGCAFTYPERCRKQCGRYIF